MVLLSEAVVAVRREEMASLPVTKEANFSCTASSFFRAGEIAVHLLLSGSIIGARESAGLRFPLQTE